MSLKKKRIPIEWICGIRFVDKRYTSALHEMDPRVRGDDGALYGYNESREELTVGFGPIPDRGISRLSTAASTGFKIRIFAKSGWS